MSMENAGTAFALVCAAGAATGIGASVVFFPTLAKLANRRFLGCSLGLAAGVMLYVSLVDIYGKSIAGFEDSGHDEGAAFMYTTFCFFGGILLMMGINFVVGKLLRCHKRTSRSDVDGTKSENSSDDCSPVDADAGHAHCQCTNPENFDQLKAIADKIANGEVAIDDGENGNSDDLEKVVVDPLKEEAAQLMHMGAATALAIAIHNFPEGLVTFVAYTQDPTVGIVLAIGIGIHNITEGLCVAMPIFYATGNRWKAFMWAILSGVSEPLGALFGYAVLKGSMSGNTYGIMFGLVAGIMTLIAADELLPTAHRYDTKNEVVTYAFIVGMFAIAMSLVIFSN